MQYVLFLFPSLKTFAHCWKEYGDSEIHSWSTLLMWLPVIFGFFYRKISLVRHCKMYKIRSFFQKFLQAPSLNSFLDHSLFFPPCFFTYLLILVHSPTSIARISAISVNIHTLWLSEYLVKKKYKYVSPALLRSCDCSLSSSLEYKLGRNGGSNSHCRTVT